MSQREELVAHIDPLVKKRIRLNVRLNITDDITVRFTRQELTDISGCGRIEDTSIAYIGKQLKAEQWFFESEGQGLFTITVPVKKLMTGFGSLEALNQWNTKHSGFISSPVAAKPRVGVKA
jgi:hypothetical protein